MIIQGVALLLVVLIGTSLRLFHLGTQSLWGDETYSVWISRLSLSQIVPITAADRHPPLYYFLLHYWMGWFGSSEAVIRLLSTLFSILAIPMLYLVGRQLFDREVGLLSALILAVSTFNVQYAQEARMYSLMVFLALVSTYFFLRFLQRGTLPIMLGYVLATTLLLYTHVYDVFVVLAQNVYVGILVLLLNHRFRIWQWLSLQAFVVVLFAPWIVTIIRQAIALQGGSGVYAMQPTIDTLLQAVVTYSGTLPLALLSLGVSVLSLVAVKGAPVSGDWKARLNAFKSSLTLRAENARAVCFLVVWLFIISVVPLLISLVTKSIYNYRYTIVASLALYVLVAAGVRHIHMKPAKLAVIGLVAALSLASVSAYYTSYTKMQAREVFAFMNAHAGADDVVLLSPATMWHTNQYYNAHHFPVALFPDAGRDVSLQEQLAQKTSGHDRVWLVVNSFRPPAYPEVSALTTLNATYFMTYAKNYTGFRLYCFEKRA